MKEHLLISTLSVTAPPLLSINITDADALTGTYFYSNMNGETKEIINPSSVEDTPFWTDYADDYDQNSLLSIAVFNNRTGELVEVTNWSAGGRL